MKKFMLNLILTFTFLSCTILYSMNTEKALTEKMGEAKQALQQVSLNPFLEIPHELIMLIFEKLEESVNTGDLAEYYSNVLKALKTIRLIDKNFEKYTKRLLLIIKRRIDDHFSQSQKSPRIKALALSEASPELLEKELTEILNEVHVWNYNKMDFDEEAVINEIAHLILLGANPNNIRVTYALPGKKSIKISILQFIARTNLFTQLIPLLMVHKVNIDEQDSLGNTALHSAISHPYEEAVRSLYLCGANVNLPNHNKDTVLHSLARLLINDEQLRQSRGISNGTNPYVKIMHLIGERANFTLVNNDHQSVMQLLEPYEGDDKLIRIIACLSDLNEINQEDGNDLGDPKISKFIREYCARG